MDIIILAIITVIVLFKLKDVVGFDDGDNQENYKKDQEFKIVENLYNKEEQEKNDGGVISSLDKLIQDISYRDKNFSKEYFENGAKIAFKMIMEAISKMDITKLNGLVSNEVLKQFELDFQRQKDSKIYTKIELKSLNYCRIIDGSLTENKATLVTKFVSTQIKFLADENGRIVNGDPSDTSEVISEWVFSKDLSSKDLNWLLVSYS